VGRLEDIIESAIPWGGFLAVGALVGASFPEETRDLARRAALAGMRLAEKAREVGAETFERGQDILAEARAEREEEKARAERTTPARLVVVEGAAKRRPAARRPVARTRAPKAGTPRRPPRHREDEAGK
jgi:hypothetical protein